VLQSRRRHFPLTLGPWGKYLDFTMYTVTTRERTFTLIGIMVALLLGALDQTIVATAMPKILQDLNGLNLYTWVVTAYLLASTSMIPIYGKLSDLYGRKVVVLIGVLLFLAGSILSGQSQSMTELIVFRAVQGLGSAGIFSTAFTVVADIFSRRSAASTRAFSERCSALRVSLAHGWEGFSRTTSHGIGSSTSTCPSASWRSCSYYCGCRR